ncbi:Putative aminotransferase A [uncultured Roseburia sp.]|uniref:Aminotransferase n=1 Tax=Brotonthovivens ammoniilytica TaxID=2981725 RepID=A0ABT2TK02_9FIRM|nr:aminotransferase class I/II-fold pyridoxal phosphate-dependent enzyme [Brotonthovivens ammoniilytica]MCU6762525.1 aminotransferase class I/II-fold pyridoxal phosphate-dependent enzyme [Brotonthovivens ammoniilytica]SCI74715.1 Putative aminotransferase A [uncultured Roseburia sp.]
MKKTYISDVVMQMPDSGIKDFFDVANTLDGAVSLGVGEPDFATAEHVRDAAIEAIREARTKYTDNRGTVELRRAAAKYLEKFDLYYDRQDEILITVGASEGIDLALRALINPGDEVLVVEPSYVSYIPCVMMCGGVPVHLCMQEKNRFRLTPEELKEKITPKTKALLLPFPCNPTGAIMEQTDLEVLVPILKEHNIFVISDEIYAELTYGKRHVSIAALPGMKEQCVVLNGFSKAFAMTGWRMGMAAGPAEIIAAMNKIHQFTIMSAGTIAQAAALEALTSAQREEDIEVMRREYDARRMLMTEGFKNMGLDVVEPEGAFYVFPSIKKTGMSSQEFCRRLLEDQKVAVIPGDAFGACGDGYIRCSYAYSQETIRICLEKIAAFLKKI